MGNELKNKYDDRGTVDIMKKVIVPNTTLETAIDQMAEEATELSHAAQKLARIIRGNSPSPVTLVQAIEKLKSEFADVVTCSICLTEKGFCLDGEDVNEMIKNKICRWAERLEAKSNEKGV